MPFVQKQLMPIPFTGGIDTKSDPHQVLAGNLLDLTNGQFSKKGEINKRYGYDILGTNIEGGGNILTGQAISAFQNEMVVFDGTYSYSYLPSTGTWLNRGVAVSCIVEDQQIARIGNDELLNPDVAYLNGMEVFAWEASSGGVRYSILDSTTKAFAVSNGVVYNLGSKPKCIAFNNLVYVFYTDGSNSIFYKTINPFNPTQISNATVVVTDGYTSNLGYDVCVIGSKMFVGYLSTKTASGEIDLFYYDTSLTKSSVAQVENGAGKAIVSGFDSCISVNGDSLTDAWISWGTGAEVRTACYSYSLVQLLGDTLVDTVEAVTLTGAEGTSTGTLQLAYEVFSANATNERVKSCTVSQGGSVGTKSTLRSVGLASKAFKAGSNVYINVAFESTLQPTYFTVMLAPASMVIVTKMVPQEGGGLRTNNMLSEIPSTSSNIFVFANLRMGSFDSEGNTIFSILGVNSTSLDFSHPNKFISATLSNNLLFVGGILQSYDGVSTVEQGFHIYPENVTAVASGADGYLSTGTYQYTVTYEWQDNLGQIQRSATSVPVSVNVTANNHVTITIPTLRLTRKTAPRSEVSVVIYRTQANGVTFNQVTSDIAPLQNDPTVDSITFVDVLSDTSAAANALVYTTGNVLDNMSPPANSLCVTYQNRLMVAGLEDPNAIWFSKNRFNNLQTNSTPVEFAAENVIGVDPYGGGITALGLLGTNLVIFKERAIFLLNGDGPNDTGLGDSYPDPVRVVSDVGCKNPNSVVVVNDGIMFQSDKGIYHLGLDGATLTYIGAPVEDFVNSITITSATLLPDTNEVVFTTESGAALVYNYFFQQWSRWTNHNSQDSDVFNGNLVFIKANGLVYQQNKNKFTDGSAAVLMSFETPNFNFASLQGYQRVFRCYILGTYKGPHTLTVDVAYDFSDSFTQSTIVDATTNVTTWGSDSVWGAGATWGGAYSIYEFRVDFGIQKCTSIRLKISDAQSSNYNEGYAITALTFEVGALPGGNRLPTSNTYGTQ